MSDKEICIKCGSSPPIDGHMLQTCEHDICCSCLIKIGKFQDRLEVRECPCGVTFYNGDVYRWDESISKWKKNLDLFQKRFPIPGGPSTSENNSKRFE
jgi:hypothetical protein